MPVIVIGSMSLTAYGFHIVALWDRSFQRGPLEWLMGRATQVARPIR
ncbi:hypothetical protein ACFY3G_50710 [Streptomyces phaeochromogenes]